MEAPVAPQNETQRMQALQRLNILDTPLEQRFDQITRLAASTFHLPIALVSLVDTNRQWFKSCYGLPVRETERSISFCGHTILGDGALVITDARADSRFADNPLVTGPPHIRFYAGHPLRTPDDYAMGTLCIIDSKPRDFDAQALEMLAGLAAWAQSEMNSVELNRAFFAVRESEARFRSAFEHAPIGIALLSPAGQWLRVNKALSRLTGYSKEELLQLSFPSITHPDDLQQDHDSMRQMLAGDYEHYQTEKRCLHKQGHIVWVALSVSLVRDADNEPLYFIVQLQDITERKQLDRMKSEFLATAAHELRTPMASIYGFSELLLQRAFDEPQRRELIGVIHDQSAQLTHMINELLSLARIEAKAGRDFNIKPQPLPPIIRNTLAAFLIPAGRELVEVCVPDDLPPVAVDAEKLQQALTNIVSNSYKYSPQGGAITLTTELTPNRTMVVINIRDQGMGMSQDEIAHIFERFFRADTAREIPGSGLGMTLVKEIIEVQGGRVEVCSEQGKWTEVALLLPVA